MIVDIPILEKLFLYRLPSYSKEKFHNGIKSKKFIFEKILFIVYFICENKFVYCFVFFKVSESTKIYFKKK